MPGVCVCVCVFVCARHISGDTSPIFTEFYVHVTYGPTVQALRYVLYFRYYG